MTFEDSGHEPQDWPTEPQPVRLPPPDPARGSAMVPVRPIPAGPPPVPPMPQALKDTTAAWLLWLFLGGWGGHNFYLRQPGAAVTKVVLTGLGVLTSWIFIGLVPLFVVLVWNVVDAVNLSSRLRTVNVRIHEDNHRAWTSGGYGR